MAPHGVDFLGKWSMPASSGRSFFNCSIIGISTKKSNAICKLHMSSDFWRRGSGNYKTDLINDVNIELSQVLLDIKSLVKLVGKLNCWLESEKQFEIELGAMNEGDQKLIISLTTSNDLISSASKPEFRIDYSSGSAINICYSFLVDQSCIRMCSNEINSSLKSYFIQ